jgi:hypothetical protein
VATLEDAAEQLVSLLEKLHQEQGRLGEEVREALQATAEANGSIREGGSKMRSGVAGEQDDVAALEHHTAGIGPILDSLIAQAAEAPLRSVSSRAHEVEQALAQVVEEAHDFLREDVVSALEILADDVRERCQGVRARLVEEGTVALQDVFDGWEARVDELEDHVSTQGFLASHTHARAVVDWALAEAKTACQEHLDSLGELVGETIHPLQQLGSDLTRAAEVLAGDAASLLVELDDTRAAAATAVAALDAVRELLAGYSFMTPQS